MRIADIRIAISNRLAELGWEARQFPTAIASKMFDTAAAPTEAVVYLADFDYDQHSKAHLLTGQYYSEGRNVLSAVIVSIPKTADLETIRRLTDEWTEQAGTAVDQSYARRLLLVG